MNTLYGSRVNLPSVPQRDPAAPHDATLPVLPCPECRYAGRSKNGKARIGNYRNRCQTCNYFAQNVTRLASKMLRELHGEEYLALRLKVELDLYPQVIEDWTFEKETRDA